MRLSILTPVRNAAAALPECLASVRSQSHTDIEHIVIDGGSTDGTLALLKAQSGQCPNGNFEGNQKPETRNREPFRFISESDQGLYDALNKGVALATGDVVGQLNADDAYAYDRVLETVAQAFADTGCDTLYGDLVYVSETKISRRHGEHGACHGGDEQDLLRASSETSISPCFVPPDCQVVRYWKSGPYKASRFYFGWMPPHPTFFVRRSIYERLGGYRLDFATSADYELMLRFLLAGGLRAAYLPEVLVRMRTGGLSNVTWKARWRANRMDRRAWEVNGLKPRPWTMLLKPLRKLPQWWKRPEP